MAPNASEAPPPATEQAYTGVDNLEMMTLAERYNAFLIRQVERYCGTAQTLVDFGAGTGTFAKAMRKRGHKIVCVEADAQLNDSLIADGFESHQSLDAFGDVGLEAVYSLNVLEHIEDDAAVMRAIFAKLKPRGVFYVYVPAFQALFSSMDRKVGHYRRYTKSMMLPRLRDAGFEIAHAAYADSLGYLASLAYKWFGNDRGDLNPKSLKTYDRYIFPCSRALDTVCGWFVGKNLEVAAVRPA